MSDIFTLRGEREREKVGEKNSKWESGGRECLKESAGLCYRNIYYSDIRVRARACTTAIFGCVCARVYYSNIRVRTCARTTSIFGLFAVSIRFDPIHSVLFSRPEWLTLMDTIGQDR